MASYLLPRRGTYNQASSALQGEGVLKNGEIFFERNSSTSRGYIVMGDGVTEYSKLPKFCGYECDYAVTAGNVAWGNVSGKPSTFTPASHNHTTAEITSFSNAVSNIKVKNANTADSANAVAWANVSGKPSEYTPSSHNHTTAQITSFSDAVKATKVTSAVTADSANAVAWGNVSGKPSTFTPASHNHTTAEITSFSNAVSNIKVKNATYADSAGSYSGNIDWANVNNKPTSIDYATNAGSATKATQDESGNDIKATYGASLSTSANYLTLVNKNGTTVSAAIAPYATNAGNASSATKATQDESGNNIKSSYGASLGTSGNKITLKNKNGTTISSVTCPVSATKYTTSAATSLYCHPASYMLLIVYGNVGTGSGTSTGVFLGVIGGTNLPTNTNGYGQSFWMYGNASTARYVFYRDGEYLRVKVVSGTAGTVNMTTVYGVSIPT